jgi:sugar phosphate isomerase/epimerase
VETAGAPPQRGILRGDSVMKDLKTLLSVGLALLVLVQPVQAKELLKVGIRDGYLKSMQYKDVWTAAKAIGINRLEIEVTPELKCPNLYEADGTPHQINDSVSIDHLKNAIKKHKLSINAFTTVIPLSGEKTSEQIQQWVAAVARVAQQLKVPVIMMPLIARGIEDDEFITRAKKFVGPLEAVAGQTGVQLTIENLGHYLNRQEILDPILKSFETKRVGLTLDICNMYWFGHPLSKIYELAEHFAPYVRYVHIKNVKYPEDQRQSQRPEGWEYSKYAEPVKNGDLDFKKIIGFYYQAGYRGDLTLEDDSLGKFKMPELREVHQQDVQHLHQIIAELSSKRR